MCLRRGGRLRGSGRIGSGRPRSCRSHRPRRVPSRGSRGCGPGPGAPPPEPRLRGVGLPAGRRVTDAVPESRPRGSRFGDVTWARIVPGGIARIERRWISSRWARTARGGVDSVELTWHYASRARPAPAPAAPGLVREPARGRRGPDPDPRPIPSRPGRPRARHLTRENVPLADVLAGYPTISRPGRRPAGGPGQSRRRDYGPHRLRASADRMADQPDGEDGEAPTPGAWRRPSGRAWTEEPKKESIALRPALLAHGAALHRCLRASRRLRGDRRGWLSTKRRTQTGAVRA